MDRKELIHQYEETPRPMGVLRAFNTAEAKPFVGSSGALPSMLKRQHFQLEHGSHHHALQEDWNRPGSAAFTFEILDTLTRRRAHRLAAHRQCRVDRGVRSSVGEGATGA